jgi:hypothetical protein
MKDEESEIKMLGILKIIGKLSSPLSSSENGKDFS